MGRMEGKTLYLSLGLTIRIRYLESSSAQFFLSLPTLTSFFPKDSHLLPVMPFSQTTLNTRKCSFHHSLVSVNLLSPGDRVAVEPATPCRMCAFCKGGRYNLCPLVKGLAMPGCDGHLTRTFVMAADFCHK